MKNQDVDYIDFIDHLHIEIHALRMIPNYKPSNFEIKISRMVAELYEADCKECKEKLIQYKYQPQSQQSQGGFLRNMFK